MNSEKLLAKVLVENKLLEKRYSRYIKKNPDLDRTLVSFQANKIEPGYRWYKFKEGYSSSLVKYYLNRLDIKTGSVLDPFAGSGTSLFVASEYGLNSTGIELLPIGCEILTTRKSVLNGSKRKTVHILRSWIENKPWKKEKPGKHFDHFTITKGAFPAKTEISLRRYLSAIKKVSDKKQRDVLRFAVLCILESISYTRKDGQYLRWDYRSNKRPTSKPFNKGVIKTFDDAILFKLNEMLTDLLEFDVVSPSRNIKDSGQIEIISGSCLDHLPKLEKQFDLIITSPPYCNRYDYTRTYALELALLEVGEKKLRELRQTMLSCTVENKDKTDLQEKFTKNVYIKALKAFGTQKSLKTILDYLSELKKEGQLNNGGIVRMIKNYFFELSLIIHEAYEKTTKGGYFIMVNDNVRYAGIEVPVDLILSEFAQNAGYKVETIDVLPRGKGNSSQQMGKHGRSEIRKCVYIWKKL
jgi:DNA modification methylase